MPKLRVLFFGLICHVGNDPAKQQADHAVLVNAEGHYPILWWPKDQGWKSEPLELKGKDIFIGSLRSKPVPYSQSFQDYVVKLADLYPERRRTVKTKVRQRDDERNVHAYLVYPAEARELTVALPYEYVGLHETEEGVPLRHNCVAKFTMMDVDVPGSEVEIGYVMNRRWKVLATVPAPGLVFFTNADRIPAESRRRAARTPRSEHHVRHYSKITEDPVKVHASNTAVTCRPHAQREEVEAKGEKNIFAIINLFLQQTGLIRTRANEYVDCGNGGDP